jgi:lipase (class 3)
VLRQTLCPDDLQILVNGDEVCVVARQREQTLVGFRATATAGGWGADVDAFLVADPMFAGKAHRGFLRAFNELWPFILEHIRGNLPTRFVGHSLGGALATLAAAALAKAEVCTVLDTYTYGCPHVGDGAFAGSVPPQIRIVHDLDPVPHLPPIILGYAQHGTEERLYDDGSLGDPDLFTRVASLWNHAKHGIGAITDPFAEHAIDTYIAALKLSVSLGAA